jgi:hypothetical protein
MGIEMLLQGLGPFETPGTQMTLMREAGIVTRHVEFHFSIISEAFAAEIAVEWCLSSVESDMHGIAVLVYVASLAIGTDESLVDLVSLLMHEKIVLRGTYLKNTIYNIMRVRRPFS